MSSKLLPNHIAQCALSYLSNNFHLNGIAFYAFDLYKYEYKFRISVGRHTMHFIVLEDDLSHPLSQVMDELEDYLQKLAFAVWEDDQDYDAINRQLYDAPLPQGVSRAGKCFLRNYPLQPTPLYW